MLKTISLRITYFLFYVGHTRCTNGVSEFFISFLVMISHENLCLNHVFMPRCLCFELIFCTRNSVAQKEGQNFSHLALLAGCPSLIAKLFSGLHTAVEPNRVSFSMHGCVGGLPRRRFGHLGGRDHDAGGRRFCADEPESGECTPLGEDAAPP